MNLVYEPTWDKALPDIDRQKIEQKFKSLGQLNSAEPIAFSPLWQARNHRADLLVTVLILNHGGEHFSFEDIKLQYIEGEEVKATNHFTLDRVLVPPDSAMPWTFIFPKSTFLGKSIYLNGHLVYK